MASRDEGLAQCRVEAGNDDVGALDAGTVEVDTVGAVEVGAPVVVVADPEVVEVTAVVAAVDVSGPSASDESARRREQEQCHGPSMRVQ